MLNVPLMNTTDDSQSARKKSTVQKARMELSLVRMFGLFKVIAGVSVVSVVSDRLSGSGIRL